MFRRCEILSACLPAVARCGKVAQDKSNSVRQADSWGPVTQLTLRQLGLEEAETTPFIYKNISLLPPQHILIW